jgi:hypothetical protein
MSITIQRLADEKQHGVNKTVYNSQAAKVLSTSPFATNSTTTTPPPPKQQEQELQQQQ